MATVTQRYEPVQYDGTNFLEVLEFIDGAAYAVVEASSVRLVLTDGEGTRKTIPADGWVIRGASHELVWQGSDAAYLSQWAVVAP